MATSAIDQVFDKLRTDETFLNNFKNEIRKINGYEDKVEESLETEWQKSYGDYMDICDDIFSSDICSLPSPLNENVDLDSIEPTFVDWTDTDNEIEYLGTFKSVEPMDLNFNNDYDSFNSLMSTVEEEVRNDLESFGFSDIQPLKDKYRSSMAQFTLFAGNQLICYICYESVMAKSGDCLVCSSCDYGLISNDTIENTKLKLKAAVVEHATKCKELFLHFGIYQNSLHVQCAAGTKCKFNEYIDV